MSKKTTSRTESKKPPALVFVDTNILLDFYRVRGSADRLPLLSHIDGNHQHFITSFQVEMEFKKHRQDVILTAHKALNELRVDRCNEIPAFLAQSKQSGALTKAGNQVSRLKKTLQERTRRILHSPTRSDPVYKVAQRLFKSATPCNLARGHRDEEEILARARRRFDLGYPPRKPASSSSMGDALNWEWILHCARHLDRDVVLVSRDGDFGAAFEKKPILNDWLDQEFRETVKGRTICLTQSLSEGLKQAKISVSKGEEKKEEEFLESLQSRAARTLEDAIRGIAAGPSQSVREVLAAMQNPSRDAQTMLAALAAEQRRMAEMLKNWHIQPRFDDDDESRG